MAELACVEVREQLAAHGEAEWTLGVRRHLSRCEGCRSELARYELLAESLAALVAETADPPAGLVAELERIPAVHGATRLVVRDHVVRNRRAYAGGLAFAALGVSAMVWRSRVRRPAAAA